MGTGDRLQEQDALNVLLTKWGVSQDGTPYGLQTAPVFKSVQLHRNTTATGNFSGTATTGIGHFTSLEIFVGLGVASGTSPTLDLYVDSRLTGAAENVWINLAHLPQYLATAVNQVVRFSKRVDVAATTLLTSDAGAGTTRNVAWADDIRVRGTIAGTSPSYDINIWANLMA